MNNNLTELVFILDKSGSMAGLEKDTIGGFNSMLDKQLKQPGEVLISTVLFDNYAQVLHDRKSIKDIKKLTSKDYVVGGCTALLDAVGKAIHHINKVQKAMPEDERPAKTLFIITTDGQENASQEYDYDKIKKMVQKKQEKKNWEFIFLGANIDAISVAGSIGIREDRASNYICDSIGTEKNYRALNKAITGFRRASAKDASKALGGWDAEVAEDYKARK